MSGDPRIIDTPRLRLRPPSGVDIDTFVEALNDWDTAQWLTTPPYPYRRADGEAFVALAAADPAHGPRRLLVISAPPEDRCLGVIGLEPVGQQHALAGLVDGGAEIGYWLVAAARGRGYATEAVLALAAHAFAAQPIARIVATVDPENRRSEAVLRRAGFGLACRVKGSAPTRRGSREMLLFEKTREHRP